MGALISKLCLLWASMYQLGVQRVLWHWTCPENSLLNWVSSHHDCICKKKKKKRTLLEEQRGNMLPYAVRGDCLNNYTVVLLTSPLCHCVFDVEPISSHLHVPASCCSLPAPGLQGISPMTGLIPHMCAACAQEPCSSLSQARSSLHAAASEMADAVVAVDRMWLWFNALRLLVR